MLHALDPNTTIILWNVMSLCIFQVREFGVIEKVSTICPLVMQPSAHSESMMEIQRVLVPQSLDCLPPKCTIGLSRWSNPISAHVAIHFISYNSSGDAFSQHASPTDGAPVYSTLQLDRISCLLLQQSIHHYPCAKHGSCACLP